MNHAAETSPNLERYCRQMLFAPIGPTGQQLLARRKVLLVGCGALGAAQAQFLVRAGVGQLRIADRDFVELSNLQRQLLYDEDDVRDNLPKAQAAARKLRKINSQVEIIPHVADINHESIAYYAEGVDMILDGTDNLHTRFLINDYAVQHSLPWIYGGCIAARGIMMVILPGGQPCLRCIFDSPPAPGETETCETAGIIAPIVAWVAAMQITQALKILTGQSDQAEKRLVSVDLWENRIHHLSVTPQPDCSCCSRHEFEFLQGKGALSTVSLCGRNSVQIRPKEAVTLNLIELAAKLAPAARVQINEFMLKLTLADKEITIFPDARAIIKGTNNIDEARSLYAHYVGH